MLTITSALFISCNKESKTTGATSETTKEEATAIVIKTAMIEDENAFEAGRKAAEELKVRFNGVTPDAILLVDCFDSKELKDKAIEGVATVFPREILHGGAVYGMYTQDGAFDTDGISLLGLGGDGLTVNVAFEKDMGASKLSLETEKETLIKNLKAGGASLASNLPNVQAANLVVLMGDAHSPKNQFLLDGFQSVAGKKVRITGGSISKNDGLNYVYYKGQMYSDSAIAISLHGDFSIAQTGRQAKTNDEVIATADEGLKTALSKLKNEPFAIIAYDCAGRMGKVDELTDELNAIKKHLTAHVPIFGTYCAGEFGPSDSTREKEDATTMGKGWHVMFTAFGKN